MGARVLRTGHHHDNFDVTTTGVAGRSGRVVKTSSVAIHATHTQSGKGVWVGLKIRKTQKLLGLSVGGFDWVTARKRSNSAAQAAFAGLFKDVTKPGEKWVAFEVAEAHIPKPGADQPDFRIDTQLVLNRHVVKYPDAQSITICVAYIPGTGELQRNQVLVGHSLVQAPPGPKGKAAKVKST